MKRPLHVGPVVMQATASSVAIPRSRAATIRDAAASSGIPIGAQVVFVSMKKASVQGEEAVVILRDVPMAPNWDTTELLTRWRVWLVPQASEMFWTR